MTRSVTGTGTAAKDVSDDADRGGRLTREQVSATDLRNVAYHEAAHVAVVRHFGGVAHAVVWPSLAVDPTEHRLWVGRTWYSEGLPRRRERVMGLAGEVAVLLLAEPDLPPWEIHEHLQMEADTISLTDRHAFDGYTVQDVDRVTDLVRELWATIETEAAELEALARELEG